MPALPKQKLRVESKDGKIYHAEVPASVTSDGVFSIGIPEDLNETAMALHKSDPKIGLHYIGENFRIRCNAMALRTGGGFKLLQ